MKKFLCIVGCVSLLFVAGCSALLATVGTSAKIDVIIHLTRFAIGVLGDRETNLDALQDLSDVTQVDIKRATERWFDETAVFLLTVKEVEQALRASRTLDDNLEELSRLLKKAEPLLPK